MQSKCCKENKKAVLLTGAILTAAILCWSAAAAKIKKSWRSIVVFLFIPALILAIPVLVIAGIVFATYFSNKVYQKVRAKRLFCWKYDKHKTIVFTSTMVLAASSLSLLFLPGISFGAILLPVILAVAAAAGYWKNLAACNKNENEFTAKVKLLDVEIDSVTPEQVLERMGTYLEGERPELFHIITADSLALVRAGKDPSFKEYFKKAALVVPDGTGILWAADFANTPLTGRVPGVELVSQICRWSVSNKLKLFFVGGKPGIAAEAVKCLEKDLQINVCGVEHGYFADGSAEEQTVIDKIKQAQPDVIFTAMGVPKQEIFIDKLRNASIKAAAVGVGGSFDVISGTLPRAPIFMQKCGIEWLFRLWLEPSRYKRMLDLPVFILKVFNT